MSGAGDKVLVVSVACRHRRDAVAKLCRALEGLRLRVIAANVTAASGTMTHTVLVQVQNRRPSCLLAFPLLLQYNTGVLRSCFPLVRPSVTSRYVTSAPLVHGMGLRVTKDKDGHESWLSFSLAFCMHSSQKETYKFRIISNRVKVLDSYGIHW